MAQTKHKTKRKSPPVPRSSTSSSMSSSHRPKTRKRRRKTSTQGTSSSHPSSSVVRQGKSHKKKMKPRKRLQIDLDVGANGNLSSSSPLSSNPFSTSSSHNAEDGDEDAIQRRRRRVAIQRQQPRRFPPNPSQADINEWLQVDTANPWVKLSRKNIKRMLPTANLYLKQANFNPNTNRITRLLPGGTLARNEYPLYVMLTPINAPKRFSVQLNKNHLYIRKLQKDKITDEYEKEKLWQAVQLEDPPESPNI